MIFFEAPRSTVGQHSNILFELLYYGGAIFHENNPILYFSSYRTTTFLWIYNVKMCFGRLRHGALCRFRICLVRYDILVQNLLEFGYLL